MCKIKKITFGGYPCTETVYYYVVSRSFFFPREPRIVGRTKNQAIKNGKKLKWRWTEC